MTKEPPTGEDGVGAAHVASGADAQTMGLMFAVAALLRLARDRGVLATVEMDAALREAEVGVAEALTGDQRTCAVLPIRMLRAMVCQWPPAELPDDAELQAFLNRQADAL